MARPLTFFVSNLAVSYGSSSANRRGLLAADSGRSRHRPASQIQPVWPTAHCHAAQAHHVRVDSGGSSVRCVIADVILAHPVGVNLTHLGNDGALLAAEDVDSAASSGDQGNGASWRPGSEAPTKIRTACYASTSQKRTGLASYPQCELDAVAAKLQSRPIKTSGFKTPAEAVDAMLHWPAEFTSSLLAGEGECHSTASPCVGHFRPYVVLKYWKKIGKD